jgi:hypothetical protein
MQNTGTVDETVKAWETDHFITFLVKKKGAAPYCLVTSGEWRADLRFLGTERVSDRQETFKTARNLGGAWQTQTSGS